MKPPRLLLCLCLAPCLLQAGEGGIIAGKVAWAARPAGRVAVEKYAGSISGQILPAPPPVAGVWLEGTGLKAPERPAKIVFSQKGYQFDKSLLMVPLGATVSFPNEDPEYHNVFSTTSGNQFDLGRYKKDANPAPEMTFSKPGLVVIKCEIHQHMRARILVVDSQHFTSTGADGSFKLSGVPAGNWTLRVMLDEKEQWHARVVVRKGETIEPALVSGPPKP